MGGQDLPSFVALHFVIARCSIDALKLMGLWPDSPPRLSALHFNARALKQVCHLGVGPGGPTDIAGTLFHG